MLVNKYTNTKELLENVPECKELLYPFLSDSDNNISLSELAANNKISITALLTGIERYIKRANQNPCDYKRMRENLIKPEHVNIAGFVNFLWQEPFICELKRKAEEIGINLNINIFPKHKKKEFQNYLAVCNNHEDLPEILIGKGFSSFMTTLFVNNFINPGFFYYPIGDCKMSDFFRSKIYIDPYHSYHPFGIEELVMVYDYSHSNAVIQPATWEDILKPEYSGMLTQMGKNQKDHFGFIMMLYLHNKLGTEAIKQYVSNVKTKQHFTHTIKNIGKNNDKSEPINIMHQFAANFIRSDAREQIKIIDAKDGNPSVCHFFLLKNRASQQAVDIVMHLYSKPIKVIIEKAGTTHITSQLPISGNKNIKWIGWNTLRETPLPYTKEHLSEIAYNHFNV